MKIYPKWTGKSETYVSPEQTDAELELEFLMILYELDPSKKRLDKLVEGQMDYIRRFRAVDGTLPYLEGHEPGVYIIEGKRILVRGRAP